MNKIFVYIEINSALKSLILMVFQRYCKMKTGFKILNIFNPFLLKKRQQKTLIFGQG